MKAVTQTLNLILMLLFPLSSTAYCFQKAGDTYKIDPLLLISIAQVESGMNYKAIGLNKTKSGVVKTEDIGLMQINSSWLPELKKSFGISRDMLLNNPCQNVYVGAWVLAWNIFNHGADWNAVGAYNAGFKKSGEKNRERYLNKVYLRYIRLLQKDRATVIAKASRGEQV